MNYILAISGGVDSAVLLHKWANTHAADRLIVAHFDHGIREDSAEDARFVRTMAAQYGREYVEGSRALGTNASEEVARAARYEFLYQQARKHAAAIVTAHHLDDVVESIAINLHRGTGWRGVAVMNRAGIERPLLGMTKDDIYAYALAHRLEWVEDSTNRDRRYLRNRLRARTHQLSAETKQKIGQLRTDQLRLVQLVDVQTSAVSSLERQPRHLYIMLGSPEARELLRAWFVAMGITPPTIPQLDRLLLAIKTARPGSRHDVAGGVIVDFTSREFGLKML